MQSYVYSVFSMVAVVIHLTINFRLLVGRSASSVRISKYRGFLLGILGYYLVDGAWGIFAGLGWSRALYYDTLLYFTFNVVFVFMWNRFVADYVNLGRNIERAVSAAGLALLALNTIALVANFFNGCFFSIAPTGKYIFGPERHLSFASLIAFDIIVAALVLVKTLRSRGAMRSRNLMVFINGITMAVALALQVIWPLTPFTSLGCLIGSCFLHIFVVESERESRHVKELEEALERAKAAEKSRTTFFSIVNHDIRTPLNAILGYSELLQYGIKTKSDRDTALNAINASGKILLQLVDDVLDFSRLDSGKMPLSLAPFSVSKLIEEAFASFRLAAAERNVELVNRTGEVPPLMLDGHRIRQILFNLVGNAIKFTQRGQVTVSAAYSDKKLELAVADTGCGITPDMIGKIFEPFIQVQDLAHSEARIAGTGLGLSICKRLVEIMGGSLAVESQPWQGTTFTMRIPGVEEAAEDINTAAPEEGKKEARQPEKLPSRVLVVDDAAMNRSVMNAFLKRVGVGHIDFACDGYEALGKVRSAARQGMPYDFIFTDFWMPNMNGMEFIEKVRADSRFVQLPIFAVTADSEYDNDLRSRLFTGIILKPITYAKLLEALAAY